MFDLIYQRTAVYLLMAVAAPVLNVHAQSVSQSWVSDAGNNTFKNPILHADYSDPDAIRVGDDYYMTASSFDAMPGLPILHSKDLVNWKLIGHALKRQVPVERFDKTQHGNGVWAPAMRYYQNEFYLYYPDPDEGIYLIKAKDPAGPWSEPTLVIAGKGLIDPCPLWDDDGKKYLTHAYAGSRAGIKSVIAIRQLNENGTAVLDEGKIVYDGHQLDPTIEGPKIYKRNGYYYLFAPAGGVSTGWQLVLRARNIYGPYERRVVMDQGSTSISGPHQGAWVDTQRGENWFIHFQDKNAYGRVVHLQPMTWENDWPVIGIDKDHDGKGEPVLTYKKPNVGKTYPIVTPDESDEFNSLWMGLQWQWQANPQATWSFINASAGTLRLYAQRLADNEKNLWDVPSVLMQKFPAPEFVATTKFSFTPNQKIENEKAGVVVMGLSYQALALKSTKDGVQIVHISCEEADKGSPEIESLIGKMEGGTVYFRVTVGKSARCQFCYSFDGKKFLNAGDPFVATPGKWIGAKVGLFCTRTAPTNDSGFADFDWFRVEGPY